MLHPVKFWYNTTMGKYRYEFGAMLCVKEIGFEFVEYGLSQVRRHIAGSTVKIRRWQFAHITVTAAQFKKKQHITHFGPFFAQPWNASPSQSPNISFRMHLHFRICEIFHTKCQNMHSGDDPRHKWETCSTVTRTTENSIQQDLHDALGFRNFIGSQF